MEYKQIHITNENNYSNNLRDFLQRGKTQYQEAIAPEIIIHHIINHKAYHTTIIYSEVPALDISIEDIEKQAFNKGIDHMGETILKALKALGVK